MADKGTVGELKSEFENLGNRIVSKALVLGKGAIDFTEEQLLDLVEITDDIALAISGDERARVHVEAQLALKQFSAEARAWLAVAEFRQALAEAILEVVGSLVSVGAKLAGEALAGALTGVLDDQG